MRKHPDGGFRANPLNLTRPSQGAFLCRLIDQVRRDGKFRRRCPDLADIGLIEAMY